MSMGNQHICCSNWMGNYCSTIQDSKLPECMGSSCRCCILCCSQFGMDKHRGILRSLCIQDNQCNLGIRHNLCNLCYSKHCCKDKLLQNCTGMHQQHQRVDIQRNQSCKDKLLWQNHTGMRLKFINFMYQASQ